MEIYIKDKRVILNSNIFINESLNISELGKLFATFCSVEKLEETLEEINHHYSILYKKIFVLESSSCSEFICTYNIDFGNFSNNIIKDTIMLHRKKDTNTLYTINALNALIFSLNEGKLDKNYQVNWDNYKNSILITTNTNEIRKLDTKIHKIISL